MAGIGFTLTYLPLYLGKEGLPDRAIGIISTLAAVAGLAQFPVGLWSGLSVIGVWQRLVPVHFPCLLKESKKGRI